MAEMRAAVIQAPGQAVLAKVPVPEPGPGQVRVRLEGSGVCGSDLAVWEGRPWFQYPRDPGMPGHEGFGRVDKLGEGVEGFDVGERVTGLFGRAYADHDVAPAEHLMKIPRELDGRVFPGEPLACAMNAFRRSDVQAGQWVAVVGAGFLGALFTQLASNAGARVVAISRRGYALKVAEQMGARHVVPLEEEWRVVQEVERLTGGKLCDRVLECAGKQQTLDVSSKLARERGTLVVAGYHQDGPRTVDMHLWNWRGLDIVNAHERDPMVYMRGMREAAQAVVEGRLDPSPLYTHELPLDDIQTAFTLMRARPDGFLKAVVRA